MLDRCDDQIKDISFRSHSSGCFSCKPLLAALSYDYVACVWDIMRDDVTPTQTYGSNKAEKLLAWPVAPVKVLLHKQWLYSQHGLLLRETHKNAHTHNFHISTPADVDATQQLIRQL